MAAIHSTLHQGLLILQAIRLMDDPGAELTAEPALITPRVLHLGKRFGISGLRHRSTGGSGNGSSGMLDNVPLTVPSLFHEEMMHGNCSSDEPMGFTSYQSEWCPRLGSLEALNLFRHVVSLFKCFEESACASEGLLSELFWPSPGPPDYLSLSGAESNVENWVLNGVLHRLKVSKCINNTLRQQGKQWVACFVWLKGRLWSVASSLWPLINSESINKRLILKSSCVLLGPRSVLNSLLNSLF